VGDSKTSLSLTGDGKDYNGVDFGEHVGDKQIVRPSVTLKNWATEDINKEKFEQAFREVYGKNYDVNWKLYELDKSLVANLTLGIGGTVLASSPYRAKMNYYYLQALNTVTNSKEIKQGFQEV
jgi:exopolyphosphatase/pppGpp-phosphohydrolase